MNILGIDPGLDGALAVLSSDLRTLAVFDMPTFSTTRGKRKIDMKVLDAIIDLHRPGVKLAVVEDTHSMPNQGVASTFNFGFTCGLTQMGLVANAIPMLAVRPAVWKAAMGLSSDKADSIKLATKLLPTHQHLWPLAKHDGRAEAALLAYYGRNFLGATA